MTLKLPKSYEILYNSNALVWTVVNIYNNKFYTVANNEDVFIVCFTLLRDTVDFIEQREGENFNKPQLIRLSDFAQPQFFFLDYSYCVTVF